MKKEMKSQMLSRGANDTFQSFHIKNQVTRCSHLLQEAQFFQLPLMVQDEAVTAGPPASQVLLPSHVRHRRIQHPPAPSLHSCTFRCHFNSRTSPKMSQKFSVNQSGVLPGLPASARWHRLSSYTPVTRFLRVKTNNRKPYGNFNNKRNTAQDLCCDLSVI